MTFVHFINCVVLSYAPYVVTYKTSILSEYNALLKIAFAGFVYLVTQLAKMLALATFFPSLEPSTPGNVNVVGEILKTTLDICDLAGIYFIINRTIGKPELKVLLINEKDGSVFVLKPIVVFLAFVKYKALHRSASQSSSFQAFVCAFAVLIAGVGWSGTQVLFSNILSFWFGARGLEFDWKYIQMALDANITLVQVISMAALVWIWTRNDLNRSLLPMVTTLLGLSVYRVVIVEIIVQAFALSLWTFLILKGVFTLLIATLALQLYVGFVQTA